MGVNDVKIIGIGKDAYNESLGGMIDGRILPWVEDIEEDDYPVWNEYEAVQRSTYFLDRNGELIYQFNITTLDPNDPDDYDDLINMILDYRSENGPNVIRVSEEDLVIQPAINNALDGDIILVDPGIYTGQINFLEINLTLSTLLYTGYNNEDIGLSTLQGDGSGPVVIINGGQDQSTILLGFEITGGNAEQMGGGILIENSSPTIDRNIIHHNHSGHCGGKGGGIAVIGSSYPFLFGNIIHNNDVSGECDCECYFGGGIYVDTDSWPIVGGSMTLGNILYDNISDIGSELYRDYSNDTTDWTPIFAHHNYFDYCPPDLYSVYPLNGWDLENCHTRDILDNDRNRIEIDKFYIYPSYPNPFNPSTKIKISLKNPMSMNISIYDIKGGLVFSDNKYFIAGLNEFQWNAKDHASGMYFITVSSRTITKTQKVVLVK